MLPKARYALTEHPLAGLGQGPGRGRGGAGENPSEALNTLLFYGTKNS